MPEIWIRIRGKYQDAKNKLLLKNIQPIRETKLWVKLLPFYINSSDWLFVLKQCIFRDIHIKLASSKSHSWFVCNWLVVFVFLLTFIKKTLLSWFSPDPCWRALPFRFHSETVLFAHYCIVIQLPAPRLAFSLFDLSLKVVELLTTKCHRAAVVFGLQFIPWDLPLCCPLITSNKTSAKPIHHHSLRELCAISSSGFCKTTLLYILIGCHTSRRDAGSSATLLMNIYAPY